jgi:hypothetical protein
MDRATLHKKIDDQLTEMGFQNSINIPWGSIMIQVDFQAGKEVLTIKERTTKKE